MADIDILSMPQAPGLGGGEYIPIVQGGVNKRTTAAAIADLAIVPSAVVWKDQVQYATTVALPTNIYDNGTGGVGATLTAVSNGPLQIDGLFQSMGDRVLIKNETPQANNGIYSVISAGSGSSPWQLERTPDFNQVSLIAPGDAVTVALGTSLAQTFWIETVFVTSVGSSPIIFSELFTPLTAGNGIEIDNFVVSIDPTVVATLTDNQTLTNKTLVDPAITGYTASEAVATDVTGAVVTIPNTGTGNNVLAISPVLTTPNLGVPSAIDLTNATNLPIGTLPKGTTDYPLVGNGSLAPSYRQVPIATGVAGLGIGVATFLGTPSSANLATAVTDETGVGSLVFSGSPALTGNPTAPTQTVGDNSTKIATTAYVQAAVSGTTTLPATKYGTIAALPTVTYANGSSGVGATLTATANGALSVDSSSPSVADAILVKNQASTFQNGIYAVTATGDGSNPFVLTRETYYDQSTDIDLGDTTFVTSGTTLAATSWTQNGTENPVVGTNPITFAQTGGPGSFVAGNGISITGTSIAINTAVTVDKTTAQTLSSKTFVSPVINGASTGTGVATAATANTLMQRGANGNAQANVFIPSYTSTATAAGTTTLTVASTQLQKFTGTTTQTIVLPDVSTLAIGHTFELNNQSTGAVTVESSGGNVLVVLAPGAFATVNSNSQTGTTAASWDIQYGIGSTGILPFANLPLGTANLVLMANGASAPSYQQILLSSTSVLGLLPAANGGVYYGSGIAGIQAVDTTKNTTAWLAGRGMFQWMTGNYAAQVTADTLNMVYIAANAVASSSGAWVLQDFITRNEINLLWGGITAIADTTPAFNCAVAILALTGQQGGGSIFLPAGSWLGNWVLAQGVGNNIRIRGAAGTASGSVVATELKPFSNATPCLSVVGNSATNGSLTKNSILEDIFIWQNASTLGYQLFIEQCLNVYMRNVTVLGGTWITGTAQISTYNCFFYGGQSGSPGLLLSNNGGTQQNNGPSVFIGGSIQTQGGTGRGLAIQEDSLAIIFIGVQISSVDGPVTIDGYSTSPSVGSVTFLECHTESSYNATDNTAFAVIGATTAFGTVKFIGGSYFGQGNGTLYLQDFIKVVNAAHVTVDSVVASKLAATNGFSRSGIRLESTFTGKLDVRNFSYSGSGSMYSDARASKAIPSGYSGDVNDNNQWWPGVTSGVGYTQLPGGMQMCWGITAVTSSFAIISFPRAFSSTTGLSVTAVPYGGGSANATSPTSTITTTGFNACSNTAPYVSWMAIGPANP